MSWGLRGPSMSGSPAFTRSPSWTLMCTPRGSEYSRCSPSSPTTKILRWPLVTSPYFTTPLISAMMAVSRGLRASNSSTTRGRPPVMSLVLVVSRGILASTSPAWTSSPSCTIRWACVGMRYFLASERDPCAVSGRTMTVGCRFSSGESVTTSCDMPVTSSTCS